LLDGVVPLLKLCVGRRGLAAQNGLSRMACEDGSSSTPGSSTRTNARLSRRSFPISYLSSRPPHFNSPPSDCTAYSRVNSRELYQSHFSARSSLSANNHLLSSDIPSTISTPTTAAMPYNNTPIAPSKEITGTVSLPRMSRPDIYPSQQHLLTLSQSPASRRSSHKTTISTAITPPS
jgi:hypothetical protein